MAGRKPKDMTGQRFGSLVAVERVGTRNGQALWLCRCDCGGLTSTVGHVLRSGGSRSCGCQSSRHMIGDRQRTHGVSKTDVYRIWSLMKNRCLNSEAAQWPDYGGRGIRICDAWRDSFEAFRKDMGPRPQGTTLGRLDNDGHYEPGNCAWQTQREQQNNKRSSRKLTHDGQTRTMAEWVAATGIPQSTLWNRLNRGMSITDALKAGRGT